MGKLLGRVVDAVVPGNVYNSVTGRWNPTSLKVGLMGLAAGQAVPGGGALVQLGAQRGLFGQNTADQLRREQISSEVSASIDRSRVRPQVDTQVLVPNATTAMPRAQMMLAPTAAQPTRADSRMAATQQGIQQKIDQAYAAHVAQRGNFVSPQSAAAARGGASVISGDAARDMFAGMREERPVMQTGENIHGQKYER